MTYAELHRNTPSTPPTRLKLSGIWQDGKPFEVEIAGEPDDIQKIRETYEKHLVVSDLKVEDISHGGEILR